MRHDKFEICALRNKTSFQFSKFTEWMFFVVVFLFFFPPEKSSKFSKRNCEKKTLTRTCTTILRNLDNFQTIECLHCSSCVLSKNEFSIDVFALRHCGIHCSLYAFISFFFFFFFHQSYTTNGTEQKKKNKLYLQRSQWYHCRISTENKTPNDTLLGAYGALCKQSKRRRKQQHTNRKIPKKKKKLKC